MQPLLPTRAAPGTPSSESTAINHEMADLEFGKKGPDVSVMSLDSSPERLVLGRRRTTSQKVITDTTTIILEHDEAVLTKFGNYLNKIRHASILTRYALFILPVAILLAVPLILTDTVYAHARIGKIRLLGLFIWLEVIWTGLWICKLIATAAPFVFQAVCGVVSTGIRKYTTVLQALEIPLSLFLWSIVVYATTPVICIFDEMYCNAAWLGTMSQVFKAAIIVAAIFLAEKTFVQLISINYHRKQYHAKILESKKMIHLIDRLYDASRQRFPEGCGAFAEEDAAIHGNDLLGHLDHLAHTHVHTRVFHSMGRVKDKLVAGAGAIASEITGKEVFNATSAHSIVIEALETERASKALARRLWQSFAGEGKDALLKSDLIEVLGENHREEAEEIFHALDRDGNGDVSLDEMIMLVLNIGQERKNRANSMHDINQAIKVLDQLFSLVVLASIAFIYATFFSKTFASKTQQLWTTFTGLAFAIGGTVTEFLSCCLFLFVKHPYDVGDRVDINEVELVVEHISLMYSVFRRIDSDKIVQIQHTTLAVCWIENVSRSKQMKERLSINVSPSTDIEDVLALKAELVKFVNADENRRDFRPDVDIELRNVNDLTKLELRVEIRHKSNFANEQLRNARRNKFMVELLAACRRIPIDPPGGSVPPVGDISNPAYSVALSGPEALVAKTQRVQNASEARLFPKGSTGLASILPEGMSSAIQNPAAAMISGLVGKRHGVPAPVGRGSIEEILPKRA